MTDGWTPFDYALAAWCAAGFLIFAIAGLFQLPRVDKSISEAARKITNKEEPVLQAFAVGRHGLEIDASSSGIAGGVGLVMVALGMSAVIVKSYLSSGESGVLFGALMFLAVAAYALFHLGRAIRFRLRDPKE